MGKKDAASAVADPEVCRRQPTSAEPTAHSRRALSNSAQSIDCLGLRGPMLCFCTLFVAQRPLADDHWAHVMLRPLLLMPDDRSRSRRLCPKSESSPGLFEACAAASFAAAVCSILPFLYLLFLYQGRRRCASPASMHSPTIALLCSSSGLTTKSQMQRDSSPGRKRRSK